MRYEPRAPQPVSREAADAENAAWLVGRMDEATPGSAAAPHTTASTSSLDLDALERLIDIPGYDCGDVGAWRVLALIQRLREAEAKIEDLESSGGLEGDARLERVRAAVDVLYRWIAANPDEANVIPIVITKALTAALAAVEEK
jgi:hypothetical protein